jgi:CBS domain-containing protein
MQQIRDVMTDDLVTLPTEATVVEASLAMQQNDIGDVLVTEGGRLAGMVTDRDIVVRAIAEGHDPMRTTIGDLASDDLQTLGPDATLDEAVALLREAAVRRVPVVEDGRPVGIVTIGDLAIQQDGRSALADISAAEPNK